MKPSRQAGVRQAKYAGRNTVNMPVNLGGLDQMIAGLEQDVAAAVRPMAQAAAEVIYRAVLKNVQSIRQSSGNLRSSIYQAFSDSNSKAAAGGYANATYHVSWNAKKAPHGHLIEHGYLQRYEMGYENGKFFGPVVRPEKRGTPKPRRGASQAEKDAYYVPREGGPKQVAARPFIRPALSRADDAVKAAAAKLSEVLGSKK